MADQFERNRFRITAHGADVAAALDDPDVARAFDDAVDAAAAAAALNGWLAAHGGGSVTVEPKVSAATLVADALSDAAAMPHGATIQLDNRVGGLTWALDGRSGPVGHPAVDYAPGQFYEVVGALRAAGYDVVQ